jgi:hypothetical protein
LENRVCAVESDEVDILPRIHPFCDPGVCCVIDECGMNCSTSKTKIRKKK